MIFIVTLCFTFGSCKVIVTQLMGINNNKSFNSQEGYKKYIHKKYKINSADLYYASKDKLLFFYDLIAKSKVSIFYGIFVNTNQGVEISNFLSENKSCYGRIAKEIGNESGVIISDSLFHNVEILNIDTKENYVPSNLKKTIVLLVSTQFGSAYKNDYYQLQQEYNDSAKYKFVIISLDDIASLN